MSDYITIPLSKKSKKHPNQYHAIVSQDDADLAVFSWQVIIDDTRMYAIRHAIINSNRVYEAIHRIVLERTIERPLEKGEFVDHINGNGLDNRRENLRLATNSQNMMNRRINANSTTGYKGVTFYKRLLKWGARITLNKKTVFLGIFDTPEEAHEAYKQAAIERHGEYAKFE